MNARAPTPTTTDPDYAAGEALCLSNQPMPRNPSDGVMAGYLDALEPRERPDALWANAPGLREPFTQRLADIEPRKSYGPTAPRDAAVLAKLPREISIYGDDGKLLRLDELKARYLRLVFDACGRNKTEAGRLLDAPRRTVQRTLQKRWKRT